MRTKGDESTAARELHLTRLFDAPRTLVWRAWTDPAMVAHWWGPRMFSAPLCEVDARKGGLIRIHMCGPDGLTYPMKGIFTEVLEPERLVFTAYALVGEHAEPILETRNSVFFGEEESKTRIEVDILVLRATPEAEIAIAGMEQGWNEQLDKLVELIVTSVHSRTSGS